MTTPITRLAQKEFALAAKDLLPKSPHVEALSRPAKLHQLVRLEQPPTKEAPLYIAPVEWIRENFKQYWEVKSIDLSQPLGHQVKGIKYQKGLFIHFLLTLSDS